MVNVSASVFVENPEHFVYQSLVVNSDLVEKLCEFLNVQSLVFFLAVQIMRCVVWVSIAMDICILAFLLVVRFGWLASIRLRRQVKVPVKLPLLHHGLILDFDRLDL